jgi:hypothetical protein
VASRNQRAKARAANEGSKALVGLAVQSLEHGSTKEVRCVDKSKHKLKKKFEATNHIEVVSYPCRIVHSVVEHDIHGEGASWNCLQLQMLILYHLSVDDGAMFLIRLFIDDACSTIVHLFCELARFAKGEKTVLKPWVLFMLIALDIQGGFDPPKS